MAQLEIKGLCKCFGAVKAVDHVDLSIDEGEMLCLLGPSGCGKTTLLRLLSGFLEPDEGTVLMGGVDVTRLPPERRPTSLVFQNYALFPHLNVYENISFGLRLKKLPSAKIKDMVMKALELVGLEGMEKRAITQLSGGQQQRVALARALVMQPKVLLLDEPLSNLDAKLRVETRAQIRRIQQSVGITSVFVTHDQEEALTMADRVAVMRSGVIEQLARPRDIYYHPVNSFVADFIGKSNFLRGSYDAVTSTFTLANGLEITVPCFSTLAESDGAYVLRPEYISIHSAGAAVPEGRNAFPGRISEVTFLGELTQFHVDLGGGVILLAVVYGYVQEYSAGDEVWVSWEKVSGCIL